MVCIEANVLPDAVQGCTDSWTNAPFAVPSIAGDGEEGPKGRAHDARASAAVHGRTVSRPRRRREAQGSSIRTMRIEPPRWVLAFLATFWAMPKSRSLARRASESSALLGNKQRSQETEFQFALECRRKKSACRMLQTGSLHPAIREEDLDSKEKAALLGGFFGSGAKGRIRPSAKQRNPSSPDSRMPRRTSGARCDSRCSRRAPRRRRSAADGRCR